MSDKVQKKIPYKKQHLPSRLIGIIEVYYVLIVIYILGYALLRYTIDHTSRDEIFDQNYILLVYLFTYSMFVFFLILKAAATYSVYEYYIALFILFQKLIVITIAILRRTVLEYKPQIAALITICALNYIEFGYLAFNLYAKRAEINFYLFKLSGVDPSVNNAFAIRKMLEVLGYVNTFVSFFFFCSFMFHLDTCGTTLHISFRTAYLALYFATSLFTYVCSDKEIRWQRIVAIILNIITIVCLCLYVTLAVIFSNILHCNNHIHYQNVFDVGIQLLIMLIFSWIDFMMFGSGLREASSARISKLRLSSN